MVQLSVCPKSEPSNEPNVWEPNTSLFGFQRCLVIGHSDFGISLYSKCPKTGLFIFLNTPKSPVLKRPDFWDILELA